MATREELFDNQGKEILKDLAKRECLRRENVNGDMYDCIYKDESLLAELGRVFLEHLHDWYGDDVFDEAEEELESHFKEMEEEDNE